MADYTYDGGFHAPASHRVGTRGAGSHTGGGFMASAPNAAAHRVGGQGAGRRGSATNLAGAAASLVLIVGVGVWGYGVMARDVSGVPVVQAAVGPMRVAPQEPGGTEADHQGLAVNTVAGIGAAEGPADQLLLAPVPAGLAAEDVATNAMVVVEGAVEQVGDLDGSQSGAQSGAQIMPAALTQDMATVQLGATQDANDPILALVAQIAADSEPLTPLPEEIAAAAVPAIVTDGSDLLDDVEDTVEDAAPASVAALTGPGLSRSLRPRLRPVGMQVASMGPVDAAVVAAASVVPTRELDADALPAGTRLVQIGAFDSPETARTEWARLEGRFGEFLDGKARVIQQAQSGGRTFYRLRAEGFLDLADARRFCAAFVAEKVDCIPVVTK